MAFDSMYIGATGMITHGQRMSVVGNNIANVNTIGFKGQKTVFSDLFSDVQTTGGGSITGLSQTGHGSAVADIITDYRVGSLSQGSDVMDLAIGGRGFFTVSDGARDYYTRAGNFRFDKSGYLVNPGGLRLQGQKALVSGDTVNWGSTTDIRLEGNEDGHFVIAPKATSLVHLAGNLGSDDDLTTDAANPYFALSQAWNGSAEPPLAEGAYSGAQTIKIYDAEGQGHTLTVYYDRVNGASSGNQRVYEYVVGMDPAEDGRGTGSSAGEGAGMLMIGTLTFSATGELQSMTAYTPDAATASGVSKDLSTWTTADFDENGYPQITAAFLNASGATTTTSTFGLDLGLSNPSGAWATGEGTTAADASTGSGAALPTFSGTLSALGRTSHSGATSAGYQAQDGYAEGFLTSLEVDKYGVISGRYSNNQEQALFKVQLVIFANEYGLNREGNNLFSATLESGPAIVDDALQGARGAIASNAVEESNVDIATEFVDMIMTQRGFQANSKIITTSDEMLKKALEIKR
ncbi:MAG: flagellar hook-basal body complex protein [Desulfovibrionaceae bacterium]|nr:flagellar hook-basal body complex protein [Desulfovibrionaceae bacterium]